MGSARQHRQQRLIIIHQEALVAVRRAVPRLPIVRFAVGAKPLEASLFISLEQGEQHGVGVGAPAQLVQGLEREIFKGPRGAPILVNLPGIVRRSEGILVGNANQDTRQAITESRYSPPLSFWRAGDP